MARPITEAIAMQVEATEGFEHLEIEDGQWVGFDRDEHMGGEEHGWLETLVLTALSNWAIEHRAGRVYPGDTGYVMKGHAKNIQVKRQPDVLFVQDKAVRPTEHYIYGAPTLAVEIVSVNPKPGTILKKLGDYMTAGSRQVWLVNSQRKVVITHHSDFTGMTYGVSDTLSGGDLLPGFTLDVASLFEA